MAWLDSINARPRKPGGLFARSDSSGLAEYVADMRHKRETEEQYKRQNDISERNHAEEAAAKRDEAAFKREELAARYGPGGAMGARAAKGGKGGGSKDPWWRQEAMADPNAPNLRSLVAGPPQYEQGPSPEESQPLRDELAQPMRLTPPAGAEAPSAKPNPFENDDAPKPNPFEEANGAPVARPPDNGPPDLRGFAQQFALGRAQLEDPEKQVEPNWQKNFGQFLWQKPLRQPEPIARPAADQQPEPSRAPEWLKRDALTWRNNLPPGEDADADKAYTAMASGLMSPEDAIKGYNESVKTGRQLEARATEGNANRENRIEVKKIPTPKRGKGTGTGGGAPGDGTNGPMDIRTVLDSSGKPIGLAPGTEKVSHDGVKSREMFAQLTPIRNALGTLRQKVGTTDNYDRVPVVGQYTKNQQEIKGVVDTLLAPITQLLGSGTPQEAEAKRKLETLSVSIGQDPKTAQANIDALNRYIEDAYNAKVRSLVPGAANAAPSAGGAPRANVDALKQRLRARLGGQ